MKSNIFLIGVGSRSGSLHNSSWFRVRILKRHCECVLCLICLTSGKISSWISMLNGNLTFFVFLTLMSREFSISTSVWKLKMHFIKSISAILTSVTGSMVSFISYRFSPIVVISSALNLSGKKYFSPLLLSKIFTVISRLPRSENHFIRIEMPHNLGLGKTGNCHRYLSL